MGRSIMDYDAFIMGPKTKLIAPAGYGKTYTIVKCLESSKGKQLILTHTNAGIAAIKDKIRANPLIPSSRYNIETISGYIQKFVLNFYCGSEGVPDKKESKKYYSFLEKEGIEIFKSAVIKEIIAATYTGFFVDEYQDCNINQHAIIMEISKVLPTHILGDPLQGIYNFNGCDLVDFARDLNEFQEISQLDTPWRWNNSGSTNLGIALHDIRGKLEGRESFDLKAYQKGITIIETGKDSIYDCYSKEDEYIKNLRKAISGDSILILVPEYFSENITVKGSFPKHFGAISERKKIKGKFDYENIFFLAEAIDGKDFYKLASDCDNLLKAKKRYEKLVDSLLYVIFNKTDISNWLGVKGLKRTVKGDRRTHNLGILLAHLTQTDLNYILIKDIIIEFKKSLKCKTPRSELYFSILTALKNAALEHTTVLEAMTRHRDIVRHSGRKIQGKCIGTTLLTKGLEFDKVIVLDAHKFPDYKNFYVAITRCCKELIVFTNKTVLDFK